MFSAQNYRNDPALSERVNRQILWAFEAESIEFTVPSTATYVAQDYRRLLHIVLAKDSNLPGTSNGFQETDLVKETGEKND